MPDHQTLMSLEDQQRAEARALTGELNPFLSPTWYLTQAVDRLAAAIERLADNTPP